MKNIRKNHEPRCLAHHRCQEHADYNNLNDKQELRNFLAVEQGYICAYCMQRIRAEEGGMKIEHWHCRHHHSDEQLDYGNLLGVCMGGYGQPVEHQHCDTRKGSRDLCRNPANPMHDVESIIRYLGDGRIKADDAEFDRQLNEVLNLNHPLLVRNRKTVLDAFQQKLQRSGNLAAASIRREIDKWSQPSGGDLHPFCMVVVYWLRKRLARS